MHELNLDGLVGPTHFYAGLATGNLASETYAFQPSNPQAAALEGLAKMRLLHNLGIKQAILPPHQRPNLALLNQLGFHGSPEAQIKQAATQAPHLLCAAFAASNMWAANAGTISSSIDTADGLIHFTPANLVTNLHRQQETAFSAALFATLFKDSRYFIHHPPLPACTLTSDEGAANYSRLAHCHGSRGIHLFVYGKTHLKSNMDPLGPIRYPARQSLEASQAIARAHRLSPELCVFARQNPTSIDLGVFHNDVIATANEHILLLHQEAYVDQPQCIDDLQKKAAFDLHVIEIKSEALTVSEAVASYLFNSQIITLPDSKSMVLIAPAECETNPRAKACMDAIIADPTNPIQSRLIVNLQQSMHNGGGPACLRLRILLSDKQLAAMHQGILVHTALLDTLEAWVKKYYRTHLTLQDLTTPDLIQEVYQALEALTDMLDLGSIYPFQF